VAKYAARIGLCFSSGRTGAKMKDDQVQRLDEIKSGNHIFSDGAGTLSLTMAQEISKRLGLNYTPSAYQVRPVSLWCGVCVCGGACVEVRVRACR
jgi:RNA-dependent RNA polymerase